MTPKQAKFIAEYLVDLNAAAAYVRAGYAPKNANVCASQLLATPSIRAEVDAALKRRSDRLDFKADDVLRELWRIANTDLGGAYDKDGKLLPVHEMPVDVRRAIAGIKVFEEFEGTGADRVKVGEVREVKFWDKTKGLELLGKHFKLYTEKVEHSVDKSLAELINESMAGDE